MQSFFEPITEEEAGRINPIVLAFLGDAVYSLFVREMLAFKHTCKTGELNKMATSKVKATAQAKRAIKLQEVLTEDELAIFKRARNAKKGTKAKSATVAEYNLSTAFEAVIGYLYVIGDIARLNELLNYGENDES